MTAPPGVHPRHCVTAIFSVSPLSSMSTIGSNARGAALGRLTRGPPPTSPAVGDAKRTTHRSSGVEVPLLPSEVIRGQEHALTPVHRAQIDDVVSHDGSVRLSGPVSGLNQSAGTASGRRRAAPAARVAVGLGVSTTPTAASRRPDAMAGNTV